MADDKPLSDNQVYDRLHEAIEALGQARGVTTTGDTTINAARQSLFFLQIALLKSQEAKQEPFKGPAET